MYKKKTSKKKLIKAQKGIGKIAKDALDMGITTGRGGKQYSTRRYATTGLDMAMKKRAAFEKFKRTGDSSDLMKIMSSPNVTESDRQRFVKEAIENGLLRIGGVIRGKDLRRSRKH